eukprot:g3506.t1
MDTHILVEMSSASYLTPLGLGNYVAYFDDEGFEDPQLLDDVKGEAELEKEMSMKSKDAKILWRWLAEQGIVDAPPPPPKLEKKSTSKDYLVHIGLEQYASKLDEEGFEDIESLVGMDWREIADIGLKKGHARKLQRLVEKESVTTPEDEDPNAHLCPEPEVSTKTKSFKPVDAIELYMSAHPDIKWHGFMSHMQSEGGDAVMAIDLEMSARGWKLWTDQSTGTDVTLEGMKRGVRQSAIYVIYLTKSCLTRPFVRLELLEAVKAKKPILALYEEDRRRACFQFDAETGVPKNFHPITKELLANHSAISWERRPHLRKATVDLIEQRILETLTKTGVGCKVLKVSAESIIAAEKCCMDVVTSSTSISVEPTPKPVPTPAPIPTPTPTPAPKPRVNCP